MTLGAPAHLYERERETAALKLGLESARAGDGELVLLLGPAGIGKSRLLAAAADHAPAADIQVLAAAAAEPEREFPFGVALQLLERVVGQASTARRTKLFH